MKNTIFTLMTIIILITLSGCATRPTKIPLIDHVENQTNEAYIVMLQREINPTVFDSPEYISSQFGLIGALTDSVMDSIELSFC